MIREKIEVIRPGDTLISSNPTTIGKTISINDYRNKSISKNLCALETLYCDNIIFSYFRARVLLTEKVYIKNKHEFAVAVLTNFHR